ncbi:MAG: tetratricopeptide repeat protein [Pseudomonadota bacterium]
MSALIDNLEKLLSAGQDNAMLRFSLGSHYLQNKDYDKAEQHLKKALDFDQQYTAAWKLLGRALAAQHKDDEAIDCYHQGIELAESKGDIQAAKEMRVFLKRLEKNKL